jgi:hypothetical protein
MVLIIFWANGQTNEYLFDAKNNHYCIPHQISQAMPISL